jgi:hypothetical protein
MQDATLMAWKLRMPQGGDSESPPASRLIADAKVAELPANIAGQLLRELVRADDGRRFAEELKKGTGAQECKSATSVFASSLPQRLWIPICSANVRTPALLALVDGKDLQEIATDCLRRGIGEVEAAHLIQVYTQRVQAVEAAKRTSDAAVVTRARQRLGKIKAGIAALAGKDGSIGDLAQARRIAMQHVHGGEVPPYPMPKGIAERIAALEQGHDYAWAAAHLNGTLGLLNNPIAPVLIADFLKKVALTWADFAALAAEVTSQDRDSTDPDQMGALALARYIAAVDGEVAPAAVEAGLFA